MPSTAKKLLRKIHPQGIPGPFAHLYDLLSRTFGFQYSYELIARDAASTCSRGRVLDVGTGPGRLLHHLHRCAPELELTGVDISTAMVKKAEANLKKSGLAGKARVMYGASHGLPFPDAYYDLVLSTGSIHHWVEPVKGLNEIFRVLKPGGRALIYDIVNDAPRSVLRAAGKEIGRFNVALLWLHSFEEPFYSSRDFQALGAQSDFRRARLGFIGVFCRLKMEKQ